MRNLLVLLSLVGSAYAQDFSYRVRQEILDQQHPVIVNVSVHGVTTLQFPSAIEALESDGFTQKPNDESGDFYISPGINWVSIRSLRPGAQQNLGIVIAGKVYEVFVQTVDLNDFSVLFRFAQVAKPPSKSYVWSPLQGRAP